MRTSDWVPNYGDMLVCAAVLKQLQPQNTARVDFGYELPDKVERAIIRGSTYLHRGFNFDDANKTIDSIDSPLAIVGLGAQNPLQDIAYLDGNVGAMNFIARLNEKSSSISVRGDFTASVVERLGGKNIRVTGCPSLFYSLRAPEIRIPEILMMPERSIGISIHSVLTDDIFCHAPIEARAMHGSVIAWAIENSVNVSIFEQGVLEEYDIADHESSYVERYKAAAALIERIKADGLFSPQRLMSHMVSVKSIEEWLAKARDLDAIVGFRFHGNMVALLQGKPCYYYVYDSRLTEFCELYGLPYQNVTASWRDPVKAMADHDWSHVNQRIDRCFSELKCFYAENGFTTNFSSDDH